nr:hypothetical protein [Tanacetum cinerariifolium]
SGECRASAASSATVQVGALARWRGQPRPVRNAGQHLTKVEAPRRGQVHVEVAVQAHCQGAQYGARPAVEALEQGMINRKYIHSGNSGLKQFRTWQLRVARTLSSASGYELPADYNVRVPSALAVPISAAAGCRALVLSGQQCALGGATLCFAVLGQHHYSYLQRSGEHRRPAALLAHSRGRRAHTRAAGNRRRQHRCHRGRGPASRRHR